MNIAWQIVRETAKLLWLIIKAVFKFIWSITKLIGNRKTPMTQQGAKSRMLRLLLSLPLVTFIIACGSVDDEIDTLKDEIDLLKRHLSDANTQIRQLQEDTTRLETVIGEQSTRLETLIGADKQSPENINTVLDSSPHKQKPTTDDSRIQGEIVFVHEGVYIMEANGQNVRLIYDRPAFSHHHHVRPKWSHDGKKIVFMSKSIREGFRYDDICIINADGSHPIAYTNRVSTEVRNPVWTSQGEIVYESRPGASWGLQLGFTTIRAEAFHADYRADGTLVFVQDRNRRGSIPNIYTFDPLTKKEIRLTFDSDSYPTWSPDGTKIAFVRRIAQHDIFVMNTDGSFPHNLTQHPADDTDPTWSPHGTHIAFMSDRETFEPHIWTMRADGTKLKKLHPGRSPDWK